MFRRPRLPQAPSANSIISASARESIFFMFYSIPSLWPDRNCAQGAVPSGSLNRIAILIREFSGGDLDKVNEPADTEQAARNQVENTGADLARIEAMDARTANKYAQQQASANSGACPATAGAT